MTWIQNLRAQHISLQVMLNWEKLVTSLLEEVLQRDLVRLGGWKITNNNEVKKEQWLDSEPELG